jgi:hypothetical protein
MSITARTEGAAEASRTSGVSALSWLSRSAARLASERCLSTRSKVCRICAGVKGLGR